MLDLLLSLRLKKLNGYLIDKKIADELFRLGHFVPLIDPSTLQMRQEDLVQFNDTSDVGKDTVRIGRKSLTTVFNRLEVSLNWRLAIISRV
jgi:hypothetical protein